MRFRGAGMKLLRGIRRAPGRTADMKGRGKVKRKDMRSAVNRCAASACAILCLGLSACGGAPAPDVTELARDQNLETRVRSLIELAASRSRSGS